LLDILYLTDSAKLPFIMGLIFYICLSFDIFHLAIFFVFLCHINICIVKQMYINFSVLSTTVKLIILLWACVCMGVHSSVNMFFFCFLSPFHFIDDLWWYWRLCCKVGRLDDLMVFHQSFVTNETVIVSCLCRGLLWMML